MRVLQAMFVGGGVVTLVVALAGLSYAWLFWAPLAIGLVGCGWIFATRDRS